MGAPILSIIVVCLSLILLPIAHAGSAIYKYVDKDGNITFTNRPMKGGQKVQSLPQDSRKQTTSPAPSQNYPRVSVNVQNTRDIKRREILEHELTAEMTLFSNTRKSLAVLLNANDNHQQTEKIRALKSKLIRHENNIAALKKELAKL